MGRENWRAFRRGEWEVHTIRYKISYKDLLYNTGNTAYLKKNYYKWSCCLIAKSHLTLLPLYGLQPPGSSVSGISQARILEWVAISFSMRPSQPRDQTQVSCIGSWILYHWATREAHAINSIGKTELSNLGKQTNTDWVPTVWQALNINDFI